MRTKQKIRSTLTSPALIIRGLCSGQRAVCLPRTAIFVPPPFERGGVPALLSPTRPTLRARPRTSELRSTPWSPLCRPHTDPLHIVSSTGSVCVHVTTYCISQPRRHVLDRIRGTIFILVGAKDRKSKSESSIPAVMKCLPVNNELGHFKMSNSWEVDCAFQSFAYELISFQFTKLHVGGHWSSFHVSLNEDIFDTTEPLNWTKPNFRPPDLWPHSSAPVCICGIHACVAFFPTQVLIMCAWTETNAALLIFFLGGHLPVKCSWRWCLIVEPKAPWNLVVLLKLTIMPNHFHLNTERLSRTLHTVCNSTNALRIKGPYWQF